MSDVLISSATPVRATLGAERFLRSIGYTGPIWVSYEDSTAAVVINMTDFGIGSGGFAAGDRFVALDNLTGSLLADNIAGNAAANLIQGLAGDDFLQGEGGNDTLHGGVGNDLLLGGVGADVLDGGADRDVAAYWTATAAIMIDLQNLTLNTGDAFGDSYISIEQINATGFADSLSGDASANTFAGGGGNDTIAGRDGNDSLHGDAGDDSLLGGAGNDQLIGGLGADVMDGGAGEDLVAYWDASSAVVVDLETPSLNGGIAAGDVISNVEVIIGSAHADALRGAAGSERLIGGNGNDTLEGRDGNDLLFGDAGDDSILGGAGNDSIEGGAGNDSIAGGTGNDTLFGGAGADTIDGGAGLDIAAYWSSNSAIRLDMSSPGSSTGDAAGDVLIGVEAVFGTAFDDTLQGDAGINSLTGGAGNDLIEGRDGQDTLFGEAGADTLRGGNHGDTLGGGAGADSLDGGAGIDYVVYWDSSVDVNIALDNATAAMGGDAAGDLFTDVEGAFGSQGHDAIAGSSGANILFGLNGNDTLNGLGGNDVLGGGEGNDVLRGGLGADTAQFSGSRASFMVERGTIDGMAAIVVTGLGGASVQGADTISGVETLLFADGVFSLTATTAADTASAIVPTLGHDATGNVTANDTGPSLALDVGAPLAPTVISVQGLTTQSFTSGGGLSSLTVNGTYGTLVMQADGAWTYEIDTAGAAYLSLAAGVAANDVFTYTITPGDTGFADLATVTAAATLTIQVLGSNRPPALDLDVIAAGKGFATAVSSGAAGARVAGNPSGNSAAWTGDVATAGYAAASNTAVTDPDVPPNAPANYESVSITLTADAGDLNVGEALTLSASLITTLDVLGIPYSLSATSIDVYAGGDPGLFMTSSLVQAIIRGVTYSNPETSFDLNTNGRTVTVTVTDRLGGSDNATATIMARANVSATGAQTDFDGTALSDSIAGNALGNELDGAAGNDVLNGMDGNDILLGGTGNDTLNGGNQNDSLQGDAGTNVLDGGAGIDTAGYAGLRSAFTIAAGSLDGNGMFTSWASVSGTGVSDTLTSVEKLQFTDMLLDLSLAVQLFNGTTLLGTFATIQAAVDAAVDGNTVKITGTTLTEDVVVNGKAITIDGSGKTGPGATTLNGSITFTGTLAAGQSIAVQDMAINASGKGWGINVGMAGADFTTGLVVDNVAVAGAINNGLAYIRTGNGTPNPMLTDTIGSITVSNSDFTDNGVGGPLGSSNLSFYGYNQALSLNNVTLTGAAGSLKAMQLRGTESAGPVYAAGGSVSFNGVTVNGTYSNEAIAVYNYASLSVGATNISGVVTAPWGAINFDKVGGTVDLSTGVTVTNAAPNNPIGILQGLSGADVLTGTSTGNNYLEGNGGADTLTGGNASDLAVGGAGSDSINTGGGFDQINYAAGDGRDSLLDGGAGNDLLAVTGGPGSTILVRTEAGVIAELSSNTDALTGTNNVAGVETVTLSLTGAGNTLSYATNTAGVNATLGGLATGFAGPVTGVQHLVGGAGNDALVGDAGANSLTGGAENDYLRGGAGNDTLAGGTGKDTADFAPVMRADATLTVVADSNGFVTDITQVASTALGADSVSAVEVFSFNDVTLDLTLGVQLFDASNALIGTFATIQAAVTAAADGQVLRVKAGTYTENVAIGGKSITIDGAGVGSTIIAGQITSAGAQAATLTFSDLSVDATGQANGVYVSVSDGGASALVLDRVAVANAEGVGLFYAKAGNEASPVNTGTLKSVTILDSSFTNNATANTFSSGRGDINLFGFNGDLTVTNVTIGSPGAWAQKALQMRGVQAPGDVAGVGPYTAAGNVAINNLTVTGAYGTDILAFYRIANFASFTGTGNSVNVTRSVNANPNPGLEPWAAINLDSVGGSIDLTNFFSSASNMASPDGIVPAVPSVIATPQGLSTADSFTGTAYADRMLGRGGADSLTGLAGDDTLDGGAGNDVLTGGLGNDSLLGGADADSLDGGADADTLDGGTEADTLLGGAGNDSLLGGGGDDSLTGGADADTLDGGTGFDTAVLAATTLTASMFTWDNANSRWTVTTGGADGTDTLASVEIATGMGGTRALFVGGGSEYTTLTQLFDGNAANGEAAAGDMIFLAPGSYAGVATGVSVSIFGARSQEAGFVGSTAEAYTGVRSGAESIITSGFSVTAVVDLTLAGLRFEAGVSPLLNTASPANSITFHNNVMANANQAAPYTGIGSFSATGNYVSVAAGQNGFQLVNPTNASFTNNVFASSGVTSVQVSGAGTLAFSDNLVNGTTGHGIQVANLAGGATIHSNTFMNTVSGGQPDRGAISIANPQSFTGTLAITDNVIDSTNPQGIVFRASGTTTVDVTGKAVSLAGNTNSATTPILFAGSGAADTIVAGGETPPETDIQAAVIRGFAGNDTITGGDANDTLDGGADTDIALYADAVTSVNWSPLAGAWFAVSATEGTDTLTNVEFVDANGAGGARTLLVGGGGFTSINAAIAAATAGDTILVAPGSWAGFTLDKAVAIRGFNAGVDGAPGRANETQITSASVVNVAAGAVVIDGLMFRYTGPEQTAYVALDILGGANVTVENSVFFSNVANGNPAARGIQVSTAYSGNLVIDDNLFGGAMQLSTDKYATANWRTAVWSDGGAASLTITGNIFDNVRTGLNLDGYSDATHTIGGSAGNGNSFTDSGSGISVGLPTGSSYSSISHNSFSNTDTDFNLQNVAAQATDIDLNATSNNATDVMVVLGGSLAAGDSITGTASVDVLRGNAGNDVLVGGAGADTLIGSAGTDTASYAGSISAASIVAIATDTDPLTAGVQPGWSINAGVEGADTLNTIEIVDGAEAGKFLLVGNGGFATIAAAIAAAAVGDTIMVASGTYAEGLVTVNKAVTILGANAGIVGTSGSRGAESTLAGTFIVAADGVTIDGMRFDGGAGGIRGENGALAYDNLTIRNNLIENTTDAGIRFGLGTGGGIGSDNWTITGNFVKDIVGTNLTGMVLFNVNNLTLTGNTVEHDLVASTGRRGINLDGIQGGTVTGNTVDMGGAASSPWAVQVSMSDRAVTGLTISGNTIMNSGTGVSGLSLRSAEVTVAANTFTGVSNGVIFNGGLDAPVVPGVVMDVFVTSNTITATNWAVLLRDLHNGAPNGPVVFDGPVVTANTILGGRVGAGPEAAPNNLLNVTGSTVLEGAAGNDIIRVEGSSDVVFTGNAGADSFLGGTGHDIANGGIGADSLSGMAGDDTLTGDNENDTLDGGAGNDSLLGGNNDDVFLITAAADHGVAEVIDGGMNADVIRFTATSGTLALNANVTNVEEVRASDAAGATTGTDAVNIDASAATTAGGITITGNDGANTLTGNAAANVISGGGGNDALLGGAGADTLNGDAGADTLTGGADNDALNGGAGVDTASFADTLTASSFSGSLIVTTTTEGVDSLTSVEIVQHAGGRFLIADSMANGANALATWFDGDAANGEALAGDTVLVLDGTYNGNFTVATDGITIKALGSGAVLQGSFRTDNGIVSGTVATWLQTAPGYSGAAGNGIQIAASNVTLEGLTLQYFNAGVRFTGGTYSNVTIRDVIFNENVTGLTTQSSGVNLTGLLIDGGSFEDGHHGITLNNHGAGPFTFPTISRVTNFTVDGTSFSALNEKGIYMETGVGTTLIDNVTMTNVGQFGRVPGFGGTGQWGAGIDVNLKFDNFSTSTLTIEDFTFNGVGTSNGAGTSHLGGAAIALKLRDDPTHGVYGPNPATGPLSVVVQNGTIDGTSTGIRVGEPGKPAASANVSGPSLTVSNVAITNELNDSLHGAFDNVSFGTLTINAPAGGLADGMPDKAVSTSGKVVLNGSANADSFTAQQGNDTLNGGGGNDTLNGGGGNDSIDGGADADSLSGGFGNDILLGGAGADTLNGDAGADTLTGGADNDALNGGTGLDRANFTGNFADYTISGTTITDTVAARDGVDTLNSVEQLGFADRTVLLVAPGTDYATLQSAINAASGVGGNVLILVAPGTYEENVSITSTMMTGVTSLTILSTGGRAATTITPLNTAQDAINIGTGVSNVTIGSATGGFTIIGGDGPAGLERGAIYVTGGATNITIRGNEISANGDSGMTAEPGSSNVTIDQNLFTGKTFLGANPAGVGFSAQFSLLDVPRQLLVVGGGTNFTVTNNTFSGTAGGTSFTNNSGAANPATPQGNTLVTIDASLSTISDNLFTGYTNAGAAALRVRGDNSSAINNTIDHTVNNSESAGILVLLPSGGTPGTFTGNVLVGQPGGDRVVYNNTSGEALTLGVRGMTPGADSITGGNGANVLYGGAGNDTIIGGADADFIAGQAGVDSLVGGAGNDVFFIAPSEYSAAETVSGGADIDTFRVNDVAAGSILLDATNVTGIERIEIAGTDSAGTAVFTGTMAVNVDASALLGITTITGNDGANSIAGGADAQMINGGGGNDTLLGNGGNDTLNGGAGADSIDGGADNDVITGGAGNDTLNGGTGINTLDYGAETGTMDTLTFRATVNLNTGIATDTFGNVDSITVGTFRDVLGTAFRDSLTGNNSANMLVGGDGNDVLTGLGGDDTLMGGDGTENMNGGAANDLLVGGNGADTMSGGTGLDTFRWNGVGEFAALGTLGVAGAEDVINDFNVADDTLLFQLGFFAADFEVDDLDALGNYAGGGGNPTFVLDFLGTVTPLVPGTVATLYYDAAGDGTVDFRVASFGLTSSLAGFGLGDITFV